MLNKKPSLRSSCLTSILNTTSERLQPRSAIVNPNKLGQKKLVQKILHAPLANNRDHLRGVTYLSGGKSLLPSESLESLRLQRILQSCYKIIRNGRN